MTTAVSEFAGGLALAPGEFANYFEELFALFHAEPNWPLSDRQKLAALIAKYDQQTPPAPVIV